MTKIPRSSFYGLLPLFTDSETPNGREDEKQDGETAETEMDMDDPPRRPKVQEEHCSQSEEDFWRGL